MDNETKRHAINGLVNEIESAETERAQLEERLRHNRQYIRALADASAIVKRSSDPITGIRREIGKAQCGLSKTSDPILQVQWGARIKGLHVALVATQNSQHTKRNGLLAEIY